MVFVIRKIRMCDDLKDYKICLINDRKDLEKQLGQTAELTGEKVTYITSSSDLKEKLQRFGDYIDKYKLQDAVDDKATVQILYEGKTADTAINEKSKFDEKVDELAQDYVTSQLRKSENVEIVRKIAQRENRTFDDLMKDLSAQEV